MTSTSFNVGLGDCSRNSSKVLKPPGGGSSDIFGAAEAQQSPRKVKQYMASNITLTDGVAPPSGTGPGSTSSAASTTSSNETPPSPPTGSPTRNGTAPEQAPAPAQEALGAETQTPLESDQVAAAGKAPDGEPRGRTFQMQSHFSLGDDKPAPPGKGEAQVESVPVTETDGNPVTGEGYAKPAGAVAAVRNRVPPGGYSSGLW